MSSILSAVAPLSRRRVLYGIGLLLAGTVVGCADEGPLCPTPTSPGAAALGPSGYKTLHALAHAVLPGPPDVAWDASSLRIAERLADLFVHAGPEILEAVQAGLILLEHTPMSAELSMSRFSRASRDERQAILRAWADSIVPVKRIVASALRRAVMFCAYSSPETWDGLGYDGPWVKPDAPPSSVCPLGMGTGKSARNPPLSWEELAR